MRLVKYPDTFLRDSTEKVEFPLSDENKIIIKNMINLMYQSNGIGLAANQAGYNKRIFVMDVSNERNHAQVFINPIVLSKNNICRKNVSIRSRVVYAVYFAWKNQFRKLFMILY